jgi:hypothetical protein
MGLIIHNVSTPDSGLGAALRTGFVDQNTMNAELYDTVVFEVIGKDLSSNDFTDAEKAKLAGIEALAQVNVPINFSDLIGAPTINSIAAFPDTRFDYVDTTSFDLPPNVQAISVRKNGNPTEFVVTNWTQSANVVTYGGTMVVGDYLIIGGVYVIGSTLGGVVNSVNTQVGDVVLTADNIPATATKLYLTPAQSTAIAANTANFLNAIVTVELDSTLTNFFYAPQNLKINSTTNIDGTPTVTIKVNNVAYTLGVSILQGDLITLTSDVIGVVNLNILYE